MKPLSCSVTCPECRRVIGTKEYREVRRAGCLGGSKPLADVFLCPFCHEPLLRQGQDVRRMTVGEKFEVYLMFPELTR